jgi:PAS domain S-box-containing protein
MSGEAHLQKDEIHIALFKAAVQNSYDIISLIQEDGTILYENPSFTRVLGYETQDILGTNAFDLVHPDDLPLILQEIVSVLEQGRGEVSAFRYRTVNGEWRWLQSSGALLNQSSPKTIVVNSRDVTEQKQNEGAREKASQEIISIWESMTNAFYSLDREWNFRYVNAQGERLLQRSREELLGQNVWNEFPETVNSVLYHQYQKAAADQVPAEFEMFYPPLNTWFEIHASPSEMGLSVYFDDIGERKRAEEAVRHSEKLYRTLAQNFPNGTVYLFDRESRVLLVEGRGLEQVGLSQSMVVGRTLAEVFGNQPNYTTLEDSFRRALQGEEFAYEATMNGRNRAVQVVPIRDEEGNVSTILAVTQDITERKKVEEALRESEERFRQMAKSINEAFYLSDPALHQILYISPAYELIWGRTCQSLYDEPMSFVEAIHPDDVERVLAALPNQATEQGYEAEFRIIRPDGEVRWIWDRAVAVRDEHGIVYRVAGIAQDITERKHAQEALQSAHDNLEERVQERTSELEDANKALQGEIAERQMAMGALRDMVARLEEAKQEAEKARAEAYEASAAKSEFLSRMSHELRTPLNAIIGFSQLLEAKSQNFSLRQRQSIQQINKAGHHLLKLINEVMDIARVETGRISHSLEPVQVYELLDESVAMMRPIAEESSITIIADSDTWCREFVIADRQRLRQILINLLSNAIKYNRVQGQVMISCSREEDDTLQICVRDTGTGMTPEEITRLFVPFERLHAANSTIEGTGLGLALSQRLITTIGGSLWAQSNKGQGSSFFIKLPLATPRQLELHQGPLALQARTDTVPPEKNAPQTTHRYKILSIEDNPANFLLIESIFEERPEIQLLQAIQGSVGIELAQQHRPDLILLDLHLPDIDGSEVFQRLKKDPKTRQIPVIVVSADATPNQIKRLLEAGVHSYLTKPLDVNQLIQLADEILHER